MTINIYIKELRNKKSGLNVLPIDIKKLIMIYLCEYSFFKLDIYLFVAQNDNKYLNMLLNKDKKLIEDQWLKYVASRLPDNYDNVDFDKFIGFYNDAISLYLFPPLYKEEETFMYDIYTKHRLYAEKLSDNIFNKKLTQKNIDKLGYIDIIINISGKTLMHILCNGNDYCDESKDIIIYNAKLLIKNGANINLKTIKCNMGSPCPLFGNNCIMKVIVSSKTIKLVKLLLKNGADLYSKKDKNILIIFLENNYEENYYEYDKERIPLNVDNHIKIIKLFIKYGLKITNIMINDAIFHSQNMFVYETFPETTIFANFFKTLLNNSQK